MKHTPHGYWLEEAGAVAPAPPLDGDRDADVRRRRRRLHRPLDRLARSSSWSPRRASSCSRPTVCGRGPSGRNGGFCNAMWFSLA